MKNKIYLRVDIPMDLSDEEGVAEKLFALSDCGNNGHHKTSVGAEFGVCVDPEKQGFIAYVDAPADLFGDGPCQFTIVEPSAAAKLIVGRNLIASGSFSGKYIHLTIMIDRKNDTPFIMTSDWLPMQSDYECKSEIPFDMIDILQPSRFL